MELTAAIIVTLACLIGAVAVLFSLPGIWFMVAVAAGCELWLGGVEGPNEMFEWRTLAIAAGLALVSDVVDLVAGSVGATKAGGSKRSAIGALVGGIAGAIAGSLVIPIIGTILVGAIGAGVGAALAQRTKQGADWRRSTAVAKGAAFGWLVAVAFKALDALAVAILLIWAAYVD